MLRTPKEVQHEVLNGNVLKAAFILGWPMMVTSLMQTGYNLADIFWVGHLQKGSGSAIAALNLSWPLIFMFMSIAVGFGSAGTALVSQYTGARNRNMVRKVSGQMLSFSVILSSILGVAGFLSASLLITAIGAGPDVTNISIAYTSIIFLSMPFMFISIVFTRVLRGWGNTITPMYLNGFTLLLNVILDPIMIFGWMGFPEMGVIGAALATLISRIIYAALAIHYLFSGKLDIKLRRKDMKLESGIVRKITRVGTPSSIGMTFTALGFVVLNIIIVHVTQSDLALAAYGIGNRMINLTFIIVDGLAFSLVPIVGQNIGANKIERAKESYWKISMTAFLLLWLFSGIFILFSEPILSFFTNDPAVIREGVVFMTIISLGMPFFSIFRSSVGYFNGTGRTEFQMIMAIIRLWVMRLPLCYIIGIKLGASGIWYGMAVSNMLSALLGISLVMSVKIEGGVINEG